MGRRILAMALSIALVFGVYYSPAINAYAADELNAEKEISELWTLVEPDNEEESITEEEPETEENEEESETEVTDSIKEDEAEDTETEEESEDESEAVEEETAEEEESESEDVSLAAEEKKEVIPEALSVKQSIGDVYICIDAPEGVFPAGTKAVIKELTDAATVNAIEDAVADQLSDNQTITNIRAFDITMYDSEGNEVQPDTSKGVVNVSIKNINTTEVISDADKDMEVFHVEDSLNAVSAVDTTVLNGEVCFEAEHFSPYAVVSIEDNTADPSKVIEPQDLIESVSVTVGGKEFSKTSPNKISKDDKIKVIYTFKEPLVVSKSGKTSSGDGYYVKAGDSYELPPIPAELANPSGYKINVENGGKILGEITVDATGKAVLKIADASSFTDPYTTATEVSASLDLELNADVKADTTKDSYDLTIGGNTYKIKIDEFSAKPPTVKKTASDIDADGNVTWTVTLTNAAKPIDYASGYSIKDTFGKGQNYVEGSFTADDGSSITPTASGSTISWNYTNNSASNVVKFTYKTHVDFVALTKDTNKSDTVKKEVSS